MSSDRYPFPTQLAKYAFTGHMILAGDASVEHDGRLDIDETARRMGEAEFPIDQLPAGSRATVGDHGDVVIDLGGPAS